MRRGRTAAVVNGVGTAIVAYSLHQSALGTPSTWLTVGICVAVYGALLGGLCPVLNKLPATKRKA